MAITCLAILTAVAGTHLRRSCSPFCLSGVLLVSKVRSGLPPAIFQVVCSCVCRQMLCHVCTGDSADNSAEDSPYALPVLPSKLLAGSCLVPLLFARFPCRCTDLAVDCAEDPPPGLWSCRGLASPPTTDNQKARLLHCEGKPSFREFRAVQDAQFKAQLAESIAEYHAALEAKATTTKAYNAKKYV